MKSTARGFRNAGCAQLVVMLVAGAACALAAEVQQGDAKTATAAARLLLPFYKVDTVRPLGATTLFSLRNEASSPVDVVLEYHQTDQPAVTQLTQQVTLAAKQVMPINLRDIPGLFVDDDGIKRGYLVMRTVSGDRVLQGDFYLVTPEEGFASGDRLINLDGSSQHIDLCRNFSVRFLNGGVFSGGTLFTIWLDRDTPPDTSVAALTYRVYGESGGAPVLQQALFVGDVAFQVSAATLTSLTSVDFGAIEFEFNGADGFVSAVLDANGLYSVGLPAACLDAQQ